MLVILLFLWNYHSNYTKNPCEKVPFYNVSIILFLHETVWIPCAMALLSAFLYAWNQCKWNVQMVDFKYVKTYLFACFPLATRRSRFLLSEDMQIIRYILVEDLQDKCKGNQMWKEMGIIGVKKNTLGLFQAVFKIRNFLKPILLSTWEWYNVCLDSNYVSRKLGTSYRWTGLRKF